MRFPSPSTGTVKNCPGHTHFGCVKRSSAVQGVLGPAGEQVWGALVGEGPIADMRPWLASGNMTDAPVIGCHEKVRLLSEGRSAHCGSGLGGLWVVWL